MSRSSQGQTISYQIGIRIHCMYSKMKNISLTACLLLKIKVYNLQY